MPPADASGASTVVFPETLPAGPVQLTILGVDPHVVLDRRYGEPVVEPAAISGLSGIVARPPSRPPSTAGAATTSSRSTVRRCRCGCRARPLTLLAGDPVDAEPCAGSTLELAAGSHLLATAKGLDTGLDVDRVVLAAPDRPTPGSGADGPTATVTSQSRTGREITVDRCPDGCWLVLGEGFHDSWSASTAAGSLGPPQLVDGGFNGWWIPPSSGPVAVSRALDGPDAADDRADPHRAGDPRLPAPRRPRPTIGAGAGDRGADVRPDRSTDPGAPPLDRRGELGRRGDPLVGPGWGLVAALAAAVLLVVLGRPRAVGWMSVGILVVMGAVVATVVRREHPYPDAGWPVRFEWLHGLGLFAAVSLAIVAFAGRRTERQDGDAEPAP